MLATWMKSLQFSPSCIYFDSYNVDTLNIFTNVLKMEYKEILYFPLVGWCKESNQVLQREPGYAGGLNMCEVLIVRGVRQGVVCTRRDAPQCWDSVQRQSNGWYDNETDGNNSQNLRNTTEQSISLRTWRIQRDKYFRQYLLRNTKGQRNQTKPDEINWRRNISVVTVIT